MLKIGKFCVLACAVSLSASAFAAGNGSSPKGKPFVEIQGQFVEVTEEINDIQAHIEGLVVQVDSLEDRVSANEDAIFGLEAKNVVIEQQIADVVAQAATNSSDIQSALTQIVGLEGDIVALSADVATNAEAIAAAEAEIAELRGYITANTSGLQTLEQKITNNIEAIAALEEQIDNINEALAAKQDIISGSCAPGTALTDIAPDGSVTCEATGPGYTKFTVAKWAHIAGAYQSRWWVCHDGGWFSSDYCHYHYGSWVYPTASAYATCPAGSILTGGSAVSYLNTVSVIGSTSTATVDHPANSWIATGRNHSQTSGWVLAKAECMRFD